MIFISLYFPRLVELFEENGVQYTANIYYTVIIRFCLYIYLKDNTRNFVSLFSVFVLTVLTRSL